MPRDNDRPQLVVRGTEILATDPPRIRRRSLRASRWTRWSSSSGCSTRRARCSRSTRSRSTRSASSSSEVEGKPFWTTFWWQVSEEINPTLRDSIARAAQGEFVRWDTPIYGRAGGKETIIIDASLMPVLDDDGQGRVHLRRGTRHHREEGAGAGDRRRRTSSCRACSSASASSTRSRRSSSPTSATSCARRWR